LFILFMFPLLGSIVYVLVIYLPNSRLQHGARRAVSVAAKAIDPNREVRDARAAFDETPTAQNQMRLAAALLETGEAEEAARMYAACLKGPFATDLEIRFGAARAFADCERYAEALVHLEAIRSDDANFRSAAISILFARCHGGTAQAELARQEFEFAVERFGTFEARAEYAIWALGIGDMENYERQNTELEKAMQRWNSLSRALNEPVLRRLKVARERARIRT
jgi:hypothetical protein